MIHLCPAPSLLSALISVPQGEIEASLLIGWLLPQWLSVWTNQPPGLEVTSLGLKTKHNYLLTMEVIVMRGHYPEVQQSAVLASEASHLVQQCLGVVLSRIIQIV